METEHQPADGVQRSAETEQHETPPFDPDPRLVTFLERGAKPDAAKWFRETEPEKGRSGGQRQILP